ncbi:hypothetical protein CROQUDRAFT_712322 [Cronartium quercuum f. sp. fusiforme G11]|uniref:Uncharacterized protein n=1 Tax=Cronartium quercuum f. sp. fusiforme G11 TaxID=708437 RepID=A0A9P6THV3_9BASI|nr:hypothetical protein CROQUDRAFT_712322 [Cronartium quercuum f. sp. fusiforme G11]
MELNQGLKKDSTPISSQNRRRERASTSTSLRSSSDSVTRPELKSGYANGSAQQCNMERKVQPKGTWCTRGSHACDESINNKNKIQSKPIDFSHSPFSPISGMGIARSLAPPNPSSSLKIIINISEAKVGKDSSHKTGFLEGNKTSQYLLAQMNPLSSDLRDLAACAISIDNFKFHIANGYKKTQDFQGFRGITDTVVGAEALGFIDDVVLITLASDTHWLRSKVTTLVYIQICCTDFHGAIFFYLLSGPLMLETGESGNLRTFPNGLES